LGVHSQNVVMLSQRRANFFGQIGKLGENKPVSFILTLLGTMFGIDIAWLVCAVLLTHRRPWSVVAIAFIVAQILGLLCLVGGRMLQTNWDRTLPKFVSSAIFIWHFFGIAALVLVAVLALMFSTLLAVKHAVSPRKETTAAQAEAQITRRQFLEITAALAPPLFTLSLTGIAMAQLRSFRVRRFVLAIPSLPRALDGLTIAQVSDMHVGRFTSGCVLREIVKTTNELRADLVLLTGDLINDALADLTHGIELVKAMEARFGIWMIEGNHDLIENGREFERRVRESGVPFLLDQSDVVTIRGVPVQLFGVRWVRSRNHDEAIAESVHAVLQTRQPDAFPILLAHHPHAFDAAADAGLPLTLCGHTHGGQLMLNERCGFGPALFRYWSGHYVRGGSQLIVSNGVGNWFPLRINAPAEIVHITLRSAAA